MKEISRKGLERIIGKELQPALAAWDDESDGPDITAEMIYNGILKATRKYEVSFKIAFQTYKSFCESFGIQNRTGHKKDYFKFLDLTTSIKNLI